MLVSQILKFKGADVVGIERHRSIRDAAELMIAHGIGAVVVRDAGGVCGILSERDITRGIARDGEVAVREAVEALMSVDVVTCAPTDKSDELMTLMTNRRIRHLPVMAGGELVGMISIGDIVKARLGELESHSEALQTYIAGSS
ncbi:MAG: CBS domain-containing protein [Alphaproteobacteria bacterium]